MRDGFALNRSLAVFIVLSACSLGGTSWRACAQEPKDDADVFVSAVELLPATTAGVVRIPNMPAFCDAWEQTQIGELFASAEMKPFFDEQSERTSEQFGVLDNKLGVKAEDLYDIASGEVVLAWLSFKDDKRRPYSVCVIADIRGRKKEADAAAEKIDADLTAGGATRREVKHGDETIRIYRTKPKPGQLKIEEIALSWNSERMIAADREIVVRDLLDVITGKSPTKTFSDRESYKTVQADSFAAIEAANEQDATVCWQWYAEPFAMGRILREAAEYDRGGNLDILELLERQGFDVIKAVGGVGVVAGKRFDVLHRGVVLAPGKLTKAARMLPTINTKRHPIPGWPSAESGAMYRLNWDLEPSFWAAESLINAALDEDLFRPMIEGIRDDPEGPQIDLAKDLLPNLDNELILVTDNTLPAGPESDRMLVALRIKNADVVARVIRKAMEVEPDAIKLDVPDFDVWKVEQGEGEGEIDAELAALGFGEDLEMEDTTPLLNHWAIAVVKGKNPGDPNYLMFSSHADMLIELGKRVRSGASGDGLDSTPAAKRVVAAMDQLGADNVMLDGVLHPSLSLRARYELLRKGELKDSQSLMSNLLRRMVEEDEDGLPDRIQAGKLPPFEKIKRFLSSGGTFWSKTDSGWSITGFILAK